MKTDSKIPQKISQLRKDAVSGDWVIIATGRGKRPHAFAKEKRERFEQPIEKCPFENLFAGEWFLQVIPNKYPALSRGICGKEIKRDPYTIMDGTGFHEVIITRDHQRQIAEFSQEEAELVLKAYQERYLALRNKECVKYILIFHNHGREAGASISHPHSQLIALPIIPPDVCFR